MNMGTGIKRVSAILGVFGLFVASAQQLLNLHGLVETHFWWVLLVAWILAVGATVPETTKTGTKDPLGATGLLWRWKWVTLITIAVCALAGARYFEQNRSVIEPYMQHDPIEPLGAAPNWPVILGIGAAYASSTEKLRLLQFGLETTRTTYVENTNTEGLLEFDLPPDLRHRLKELSVWEAMTGYLANECERYVQNKSPRSALQRFAQNSDRIDLIKYFETDSLLSSLATRRPSIAAQLIPYSEEWRTLRTESHADYASILGWHQSCVGMPYPVFRFLIDNGTQRNTVLFAVRYYVLHQHHTFAAGPTPEVLVPGAPIVQSIDDSWRRVDPANWVEYELSKPKETYLYLSIYDTKTIDDAKTGVIRIPPPIQRDIQNPLLIPANSSSLMNLQLYLECSQSFSSSGETLLLAIELVTNIGVIRTEELVLKALPYCG
jgi:hypothetical protein